MTKNISITCASFSTRCVVSLPKSTLSIPAAGSALEERGDLLDVVAALRDHGERVRERVRRQRRRPLRGASSSCIASASCFETKYDASSRAGSLPATRAISFICAEVASFAHVSPCSSRRARRLALDVVLHETTQVPKAMKRPSRNIPMSTVTVAANVVERFAPSDRRDSETRSFTRSYALVAAAALVSGEPPVLERDHAAAHLVDHLAVVRHHQDRRARAVDPVEELHDPDGRVGVEVPGRLVADEQRRVVDERARDRDALLLATGELVGQGVHLVREADHVHDLGHLAPDRVGVLALNLERVGDVLGRACGSGGA